LVHLPPLPNSPERLFASVLPLISSFPHPLFLQLYLLFCEDIFFYSKGGVLFSIHPTLSRLLRTLEFVPPFPFAFISPPLFKPIVILTISYRWIMLFDDFLVWFFFSQQILFFSLEPPFHPFHRRLIVSPFPESWRSSILPRNPDFDPQLIALLGKAVPPLSVPEFPPSQWGHFFPFSLIKLLLVPLSTIRWAPSIRTFFLLSIKIGVFFLTSYTNNKPPDASFFSFPPSCLIQVVLIYLPHPILYSSGTPFYRLHPSTTFYTPCFHNFLPPCFGMRLILRWL